MGEVVAALQVGDGGGSNSKRCFATTAQGQSLYVISKAQIFEFCR
jgi:hypothetical protein